MAENKRERVRELLESGKARLHPLTFPQRELWEAAALPAADLSNDICAIITVRGKAAPGLLQSAMEQVVARQEVLRLSILPGSDRPVQLVREHAAPVLRFHDADSSKGQHGAIEEQAKEFCREPFDLARGPLYRVNVLRRAADDYVLVFTIHHAIADGWSLGVFMRDLWSAYARELTGVAVRPLPVPLSYSDWGALERTYWQPGELKRRAAFWKPELAGARRLWSEAEASSSERTRWVSRVPDDLTRAVRELARRTSATMFSALLAAFQVALSRWTGADDILVGTPVAQRSRRDVRETMGYFSGIVPLRGRVEPGRKFSDQLKEVHQTTVDCFANAMPFVELAHALGDRSSPQHHPVFEVRFALQNHPMPDLTLPGLLVRLKLQSTGTARFDLGCEITEEGQALEVVWLFRPDRFDVAAIGELDALFQAVLARVCSSPQSPA